MSEAAGISGDLVERVAAAVRSGRQIRRRLPNGGVVHIDRPQPFLCVYRRPPQRSDRGTERLLHGQASFVLADGSKHALPSLRRLCEAIVRQLVDAFGAAILLELWSGEATPPARPGEPPETLGLRIVAPTRGAPAETLETLEHALLVADWQGRRPVIDVDFSAHCKPPGLPALLPAASARRLGCHVLGLELEPFYRDPDSDKLLPAALRHGTATLGKALAQSFYAFAHAHAHARYRPEHYHALGRRTMTPAVRNADRILARVGDSFDLLLQVTPTNAEEAWYRFRRNHCAGIPEFHYRPLTVDPGDLKRKLYTAPIEAIEDPAMHQLLALQRDELDRQITMLADRGTSKFLLGSRQVYGRPDDRLLALARRLIEAMPPHAGDDRYSDFVGAEAFAEHAKSELAHYRRQDPSFKSRVEIRDDVPGLMVSRGRLLIGHTARVARSRVEATLQHEIGTHIITYFNGLRQPFQQFHTGMPGYEELQEGLAVLAEYLVGGLSRPRLRLLAGRVVAVESVVRGADFLETFRELHHEHDFSQRMSYTIAMRVHRGGGFTKDVVYLRGLAGLLDHLAEGHALDDLLVGKISLEGAELVAELGWRDVIKRGGLRPRYLDQPGAQERLSRLRKAGGIVDLVAELAA